MITKEMVEIGYDSHVIRLGFSPNEDGIVCFIGDDWFYFGGLTAEETDSVEDYERDIPKADIVQDIFNTLESFRKDGERGHEEIADEYTYCECYLREHEIKTLYELHYIWGETDFDTIYRYNVQCETAKCYSGWLRFRDGYKANFRASKSRLNQPVPYTSGKYFCIKVLIDALTIEEAKEQARKIICNYIHGMADRFSSSEVPTAIESEVS